MRFYIYNEKADKSSFLLVLFSFSKVYILYILTECIIFKVEALKNCLKYKVILKIDKNVLNGSTFCCTTYKIFGNVNLKKLSAVFGILKW